MKYNTYDYQTKIVWLPERNGRYYREYVLAYTIGPWVGQQYNTIGRTVPGAISKLANVLRHGNIGRLNLDGPRPDAIIGLNREGR